MRTLIPLLSAIYILSYTGTQASNTHLNWDEHSDRLSNFSPTYPHSDTEALNHGAPATSEHKDFSLESHNEGLDFIWIGCNLETMRFIISPCVGAYIPGAIHTEGAFWEITLEDLEKRPFRYSA